MGRGRSLKAPRSPGKVGSGWGAGAHVVPAMKPSLGCTALHSGEVALGEMVHGSFKNVSARGAIYVRGRSAAGKQDRQV